ncbi:TetR family transcriptional regulator [Leptospira kobayashii]|uniref:TetR family transcriptional regulator n=1 Tax=Leptospira kobayashii TaxID=1917830 RepID=A0ABN6KIJ6_9LEPT|nr:TetR/AcrR family transcriptional regulator [Leptospira kobayashii]BDA80620.1 TetR family transcriptional regulator [Leptospira kobayashii]
MSTKGDQTKLKMIKAMAESLETIGYSGTGMNEIVKATDSPKGSLYFHFPGGKEDLASQALTRTGEDMGEEFAELLKSAKSPAQGISKIFQVLEERILKSNYAKGCPIATTALETASENNLVNKTCSTIFTSWADKLSLYLQHNKVQAKKAKELSYSILSLWEGAVLLSKTNKTTEPLKAATKTAEFLIQSELTKITKEV